MVLVLSSRQARLNLGTARAAPAITDILRKERRERLDMRPLLFCWRNGEVKSVKTAIYTPMRRNRAEAASAFTLMADIVSARAINYACCSGVQLVRP